MNINDIVKASIIERIFDKNQYNSEFFIEVNNDFSEFGRAHDFPRSWALKIEDCLAVVVVLQRHSIFKNGQMVYKNQKFNKTVIKDVFNYRRSTDRYKALFISSLISLIRQIKKSLH